MGGNIKKKSITLILSGIILMFSGIFISWFLVNYGKNHWDVLEKRGPIGDFIAGTVGQVINLIGAVLVYFSFREQFKANQQQLKLILEQKNDTIKNDIESRFFFLLKGYFRIEEQQTNSGKSGKPVFGLYLHELKVIQKYIFELVKKIFNLSNDFNLLSPNCQYGIVNISTEIWFDGLLVKFEKFELYSFVKTKFSKITGLTIEMDDSLLGGESHLDIDTQTFDKLFEYASINNFRNIEGVELYEFGKSKSNYLSAYLKIFYNIIRFINNQPNKNLTYLEKTEKINFFMNFISNEEMELLAYIGLSKELWGLEIGPKESYIMSYKNKQFEKSKMWINNMFVSKYKLFDHIFFKDGSKSLFMIYLNHTSGSLDLIQYDEKYFLNIWEES